MKKEQCNDHGQTTKAGRLPEVLNYYPRKKSDLRETRNRDVAGKGIVLDRRS
jgi:hypothetical protein